MGKTAKEKSIMGFPMNECMVCQNPNVHIHHCIHGTANRKLADKYGLIVPLCQEHHTGRHGVHFDKDFDLALKKLAQEKFEGKYGANISFRDIFGKSYL